MQMGRDLASWNDGIHWPEKPGSWGVHPGGCWKHPSLSLHLAPSRAHSPHLGHDTLCRGQLEAHSPYQGVPRYESIMDLDTGEQKMDDSLAGLRHPSIYKEGN